MQMHLKRRIIETVLNPKATLNEIAELIRTEPGLAKAILTFANSAYYAIPAPIRDVKKALGYLGVTTLVEIIMTSK